MQEGTEIQEVSPIGIKRVHGGTTLGAHHFEKGFNVMEIALRPGDHVVRFSSCLPHGRAKHGLCRDRPGFISHANR